jgi:hypothetical protein
MGCLTRFAWSMSRPSRLTFTGTSPSRGARSGGRFVAGMSASSSHSPRPCPPLRLVRRTGMPDEEGESLVVLSAANPLNLNGRVSPGERVQHSRPTGSPTGAAYRSRPEREGGVRWFQELPGTERLAVERALARKRFSPTLRAYVGMAGSSGTRDWLQTTVAGDSRGQLTDGSRGDSRRQPDSTHPVPVTGCELSRCR